MRVESVPENLLPSATETGAEKPSRGFTDALKAATSEIEAVADDADRTSEGLVTGDVDIHEAMVAMEKANLVLKLGTTVRNKLLEAYTELSRAGG